VETNAIKDKARIFMTRWLQLGDPEIVCLPEYPNKTDYPNAAPLVPGRKFRADFVFPEQEVIVEIDGGLFGFRFYNKKTDRYEKRRGGHSSVSGQLKDMERSNLLAAHGWRVIRFTPQHLDENAKDPAACIALVLEALRFDGMSE
jgi:very-short-patch-repair endonuclease